MVGHKGCFRQELGLEFPRRGGSGVQSMGLSVSMAVGAARTSLAV